ncbi:hypothetical protein Bca52824_069397 [Brassica carinata]|uniref:Uncharacterized protein n=1 Tax=Brassica carinata TaxID=52824 RepID=A0A8X7Q3N7_BRACI|nr:hypothetical protein Bca52824_069397 [Brassica carinata]
MNVTRQNTLRLLSDYHLPDSIRLSMVLDGIGHNCWFVFVEAAVKVDNCLNHEFLEKDKNDSLLLDGYTLEEDLEAEKTTNKRELELSDGEKSRKKNKG